MGLNFIFHLKPTWKYKLSALICSLRFYKRAILLILPFWLEIKANVLKFVFKKLAWLSRVCVDINFLQKIRMQVIYILELIF